VFDATVTSLFLPLLSGKSVTLLPEAGQFLAEQPNCSAGFSLLKVTPAHLELLNQLLPSQILAGLTHCLVIGGESLSELSISRWRRHAPQTRLTNEYGPTETVVGCTVYEVQPSDPEGAVVPIGRPIWNTQVYDWMGASAGAHGYEKRLAGSQNAPRRDPLRTLCRDPRCSTGRY
jgi:non-ribosomal peptide synthetase component F